jgi:hypothetical protein
MICSFIILELIYYYFCFYYLVLLLCNNWILIISYVLFYVFALLIIVVNFFFRLNKQSKLFYINLSTYQNHQEQCHESFISNFRHLQIHSEFDSSSPSTTTTTFSLLEIIEPETLRMSTLPDLKSIPPDQSK